MKKLLITLPENLSTALGYTLLHSLWQGVCLLILFLAVSQFLKTSQSRYISSMVALFSQLLVSAVTFCLVFQPEVNQYSSISLTESNTTLLLETFNMEPQAAMANLQQFVGNHHEKLTWLWIAGVAFLLIRMAIGFLYTQKLKTTQIQKVEGETRLKMGHIMHKLGINQEVDLLESLKVSVPLTIGWLKPVILFPAGMLVNLPMNQIEAILAHELAHIKRKDYLFNILQNVVETIFFFHPAVWILSARIRTERENCCDDVAIDVCQNKIVLANALAEVAGYQSQPMFGMAFGGQKNSVLGRIKRIVGISEKQYLSTGNWLTLTLFLCLGTAGWTYANEKTEEYYDEKQVEIAENLPKIDELDINEPIKNLREMQKDTFPFSETEIKMEKLGKEMNVLSAAMTKYSEIMQEHSKEINSKEMQALSKEMEKLSMKMEKPSAELGELSKEVSLLSLDIARKNILKEDATKLQKDLDKAQVSLKVKQEEMTKISAEMTKLGGKMQTLHEPMAEIQKKMEKQRVPMDSIAAIMNKKGAEMSKLGEQLKKEHEEMTSEFGPLLKKEGFSKSSDTYEVIIAGGSASVNGKSLSASETQKLKELISNHFRKSNIDGYDEIKIRKDEEKPSYMFKKGNIRQSSNWTF